MNIYLIAYKLQNFTDVLTKTVVAAESEQRALELIDQPGMIEVNTTLLGQDTPEGILAFDGI